MLSSSRTNLWFAGATMVFLAVPLSACSSGQDCKDVTRACPFAGKVRCSPDVSAIEAGPMLCNARGSGSSWR